MRKEVEQLALMGAMPDEADEPTGALINNYVHLLDNITMPVTREEACILIKLFPPISLYEVEWTLLHLIESTYSENEISEYRELIKECNSAEFKKILLQRLDNSQRNKVTDQTE